MLEYIKMMHGPMNLKFTATPFTSVNVI